MCQLCVLVCIRGVCACVFMRTDMCMYVLLCVVVFVYVFAMCYGVDGLWYLLWCSVLCFSVVISLLVSVVRCAMCLVVYCVVWCGVGRCVVLYCVAILCGV